MKKILIVLLGAFLLFLGTSQVYADSLIDNEALKNSGDKTELNWLKKLLGPDYNDLILLGKDEGDFTDDFWKEEQKDGSYIVLATKSWDYAVLKYGIGKKDSDNFTDHYAIWDNNYNDHIDFDGICESLPEYAKLSHISYFGPETSVPPSNPVPEPATMLLLGSGLLGLAGFGRKKFKK